MKRKLSLTLVIAFVITLFGSWQFANAATNYATMKVGQTKYFTPKASEAVNSASWYVAGDSNALDIVYQDGFSCEVVAVAPTSSYAILRCDYNYITYINGFPRIGNGYTDYYVTVDAVAPSSVSVSPSEISITEGNSYSLNAKLSPTGATTSLHWSSENSGIASVSSGGYVTGNNEGRTKITVTTDNGKSSSCTVTVTPGLKSLSLKSEESMITGESTTLDLSASPANASGYSVSWSSSDTDVVKITSKTNHSATVTAVGDGTAKITATANGKSATCTISVKRPEPTSISIPGEISILSQKTEKLTAEILPADADKTIKWSSSDEKIVKVSEDGTITALNEGTATITAKTVNGIKATCVVTVTLRTPQNITVSDIDQKTYGDEDFSIEVIPDSASGLNDFTYSSSNSDVAVIDDEGNITVKASGKTDITVSQAGNDTYAPFISTQELIVNKKSIKITANPASKKAGAKDPEFTYTVTGELVGNDEIKGELSRDAGEQPGTYKITAGTVKINDNYDIIFEGADFEIFDKTPQNITVSDIKSATYGDTGFTISVIADENANLTEFSFESSDTSVAEISENGTVTIKGAGETDITVKQAGNDEYAEFIHTGKLVVNKKDIEITSVDFENKTAEFDGICTADTQVILDFTSLKFEITKKAEETTNVIISGFTLSGEKCENYNVITESVATSIKTSNIVTVSTVAENGSVTGNGSYVKGYEVTLKATGDKGYKFKGWYNGETLVSKDSLYTFTADENLSLTAQFKKNSQRSNSSSGGGGGSASVPSFKVTFMSDNSKVCESQTVKKNDFANKPIVSEREGFIFDGWYTDKDFTNEYSFETPVTKNTALYAKWTDLKSCIVLTIGEKRAKVFGKEVENDVAPILVNSRTMLPARFIAESLGAQVLWSESDPDKVLIKKGNDEITIYIGSDKAYVNNEEIILDSPAFLENDRTYMPVRFISEQLGADVDWIEETQEVIIAEK